MEYIQVSPNALKAPKNLRCLLLGSSEAGKSFFIGKLIRNKDTIFQKPGYAKFIFCSPNLGGEYSSPEDLQYQTRLQSWAHPSEICFLDHMISYNALMEHKESTHGRILLIIDDFSREVLSDNLTYDLFTKLSTHKGLDSVVSIHLGVSSKSPGRWYPVICDNSNFITIFNNIANRNGISSMSNRIFPRGKNFLQRCLNEATNICGTHAYIVVDADLKNPLNNRYGVRTNIFNEQGLPLLLFKNPKVYYGTH